MAQKKYKPEEIIHKLREAEVLLSQGRNVEEACRKIGVTKQTCYRWRQEYGGLRIDQARRLKERAGEDAGFQRVVDKTQAKFGGDEGIRRYAFSPSRWRTSDASQSLERTEDKGYRTLLDVANDYWIFGTRFGKIWQGLVEMVDIYTTMVILALVDEVEGVG